MPRSRVTAPPLSVHLISQSNPTRSKDEDHENTLVPWIVNYCKRLSEHLSVDWVTVIAYYVSGLVRIISRNKLFTTLGK